VSRSAHHTDDVSAVVLTTGEPTTQAAIDSLHRQVTPISDIIVVRDVAPFHKAINAGVAQVKTAFFVQVDADMVLDDHCVAALREGVRADVGIVVGHLRDPLLGQVVGIKLFRSACFQHALFQDSISLETDFVADIARAGWKTVYVGQSSDFGPDQWATFGEHCPNYSTRYTYRKFLIQGCRFRYRQTVRATRLLFAQLGASRHPSALAAQVGLAHGIFLEQITDLLGASGIDEDFVQLEQFLCSSPTAEHDSDLAQVSHDMPARERFRAYFRLGVELLRADDLQAFKGYVRRLNDTRQDDVSWISKIALFNGLFSRAVDDATVDANYQTLCKLLSGGDALLGSAATDPLDSSLNAAIAYAMEVGLDRFAIDGAKAGEYRIDRSVGRPSFRATGRSVTSVVLPNSRSRIKAPFRLLGHFVCTEPKSLLGTIWCLDLLKSGYAFVHVLSPLGPKKIWLAGQLVKNGLSRVSWLRDVAPKPQESSLVRSAFGRMARRRKASYRSEPGRILMITTTYNRGDSEGQMLTSASALIERGFDVRMMALYASEPDVPNIAGEISRLGITPQHCSDFPPDRSSPVDVSGLPPWFADKVASVCAVIRQSRPAIVHAWGDVPAVVSAYASCALGAPRVVLHQCGMQCEMRHYGAEMEDLLWEGYRGAIDNPAVKTLNNSAAGAADYERWLGLRPGTIRVVYNGVSRENAKTPPSHEVVRYRTHLGLPRAAPVVGTVMRFIEDKDPILWIDTAAEIAKARPDVRFLLAGCGKLQSRMMRRIEALNLGDRIVLPGAATDVGLLFAALDVLLLTSVTEGLPDVLIEAQVAGCPVVAPDVGGVSEAISERTTGRIVRERSPQRLAEAVLAILGDPEWTARARADAPAFVAGRFGLDRMAQELIEVYGLPDPAAAPTSGAKPVV
jgi:glycosyltransferase involved in cell wall biosynthesis